MEKKFKNKLAVTGSKSLLKAFEEELINLGYIRNNRSFGISTYIEINLHNTLAVINGEYTYSSQTSNKIYNLPQDWEKTLQLAAEVEEEIPEYVECISSVEPSNFTVGKIYHIPNLIFTSNTGYEYLQAKSVDTFYPAYFKWKASTKEAFEAQNKPKFKDGDWLYTKLGSFESLLKFKSLNGSNNVTSDEIYEHYFSDGKIDQCKSHNYAALENCELATKEQIERILTKVAESKYPVGCRIDQRTAYNGSGDKYVIENSNIDVYYDEYAKYWNVAIDRKGVYQTTFGKWAEIIPNEVKVKGYKIEKLSDTEIKIGCKVYTIMSLKRMFSLLREYGGAYSHEGVTWTADDIRQVIDTYDNV